MGHSARGSLGNVEGHSAHVLFRAPSAPYFLRSQDFEGKY